MSGGGRGGTVDKPPVSVSMSSSALTSSSAVVDFSRGGDELGLLTGTEDTSRAASAGWEAAGLMLDAGGDGGGGGGAGEGARRAQVGGKELWLFGFAFCRFFCFLSFVVFLFLCFVVPGFFFFLVFYALFLVPGAGRSAAYSAKWLWGCLAYSVYILMPMCCLQRR